MGLPCATPSENSRLSPGHRIRMNLTNPTRRRACFFAIEDHCYSRLTFRALLYLTAAAWPLFMPVELRSQSTLGGTIVGQVQNATTGVNLNNARVAVNGTILVSFTDESGT